MILQIYLTAIIAAFCVLIIFSPIYDLDNCPRWIERMCEVLLSAVTLLGSIGILFIAVQVLIEIWTA